MATDNNIIRYIIACVNEFAKKYLLTPKDAFNYLDRFKGLAFIIEFYETEHQLSLDEAIDDLTHICSNNGGGIK